ncbi:MAG: hypothetical protein M3014_02015 [Chloroflexota bacterium]|nr:hypothetical protein [Chloroflexota bacterium]
MPRGTWAFDPGSGGLQIPERVKVATEQRLREYTREHLAGRFTRLEIRFKGQFCYIDAYTEPAVPETWPPVGYPETREQMIERLRNTPTHLCRLRYFGGDDRWGFAFYAYSSEKYVLSTFPSGEFLGKPDEALAASALYL